jgi:hypothetical protein
MPIKSASASFNPGPHDLTHDTPPLVFGRPVGGIAEGIQSHRRVKGENEASLDSLLKHVTAGYNWDHSNEKGDEAKGNFTTSSQCIGEDVTIRTSLAPPAILQAHVVNLKDFHRY